MKRPNIKDYINKSTKIQLIADQEKYIDFLEKQIEAINYARSSTFLKEKYTPEFYDWLDNNNFEKTRCEHTFKKNNTHHDIKDLFKYYEMTL